jgi:hypothetical protein
MIIIDSVEYDVPIKSINRKSETLYKYGERTEDGVLHSEVLGVYINYDLECGMSVNNVLDYAALYLKITEAVSSHTITLLGDTFSCYFAGVRDEVAKIKTDNYFRNLAFSVIAISPTRVPS